jgi:hypothetical protein
VTDTEGVNFDWTMIMGATTLVDLKIAASSEVVITISQIIDSTPFSTYI